MEMGDDIYLIKFKTEDVEQETDIEEGGDGKDGKGGEDNLEEDDLGKEDSPPAPPEERDPKGGDTQMGESSAKNAGQKSKETTKGHKAVRNLLSLLEDEHETGGIMSQSNEIACINLLKAMELGEDLEGTEVEESNETLEEQEIMNLPEEWIYNFMEVSATNQNIQTASQQGSLSESDGQRGQYQNAKVSEVERSIPAEPTLEKTEQTVKPVKAKKKKA